MRVRYTGPEEAVDLALPGACIQFERLTWLDLEEACEAAGIDPAHAAIAARGLKTSPVWEIDTKTKTKSTPDKDGER